MKLPIRTKVAVIVSLIIVFLGLLASLFVFVVTREALLNERRETLLTLVSERAGTLSKTMLIGEDVAQLVSEAGLIKRFLADPNLAPDEAMNVYLEHFNIRNEFSAIYLMTATGSAVASTDRTFIDNNYSFRNYFKDALAKGAGREVAIGVTSKQQGFYFSFPVKDGAGKILGVAIAKMRNAPFDDIIKPNESDKLGESILVDDDGIILFSSKPEWIFRTLSQIGPERLAALKAERKYGDHPLTPLAYEKIFEAMAAYQAPTTLLVHDRLDNRGKIVSLAKIDESRYYLILESGVSELVRQSLMLSLAIAGFVLLTALVTNALTVGFLERFLKPLDDLMKAVRQVGGGDFSTNIALKTGDELEELGDSFNQMMVRLRESYSDLNNFKRAVENASSHIVITDPDAKIIYANPAASRITGYSNEEMVGNNPRLWGKQMSEEFYQKMWQQIKFEKKPFRAEMKNKRKNGETYTATMTISPILDEKDNLLGFVGLEDDISDRIKAEDALRVSEERFRSLITNSSDVIALLSAQGIYTYVSPSVERVLGFPPDHYLNKNAFEYIHPNDHEEIKAGLQNVMDSPRLSVKFQNRMMHKDGAWHWVEGVGTNALKIPGINAIIVNYRDITDRKTAENNLILESKKVSDEKAKDEAVLASIGEGVAVVDESGKVLLVNDVGLRLFGSKAEDLVGKRFDDGWQLKDNLGNIITSGRPIELALVRGKTISTNDYSLIRKDGTDFPAHITVSPVRREEELIGAVMVFRDVMAERAIDRAKSEFVSLASHQLRTPLSAVNWYIEMLLNGDVGPLDTNQKKYLEEVYGANRRMVELVNSLLNTSRIDLGTYSIEPESLQLVEVVKTMVGELRPQITFKKLNFSEDYDQSLPIISADPKLIRIVIQNVLANAVKYTPEGGNVGLEIKLAKKGEKVDVHEIKTDSILIKTTDTGYGIPDRQKDKVFQKLFRADNAKEKETEGTGLGLYIVKAVLDSIGGEVWFSSVENSGSTFYVTIPLRGMPRKVGEKSLTASVPSTPFY